MAAEHLAEQSGGPDSDRGKQCVPVGEVPVGRRGGDTEAPAGLGHGERRGAALADQRDGGLDQGIRQAAVVIASAPCSPCAMS